MNNVIITEKPSVAKTIAVAIGNAKYKNGAWVAGKWIIVPAQGHIIGLANPDKYDKKYKKWNLNDLPIIPKKFKLVVKNRKVYSNIKKYISKASLVVNACDAGREGELIFREIITLAKPKAKLGRLWLQSLTRNEIITEVKRMSDLSKYNSLAESAWARSYADWIVGINATRAFTVKVGKLYTIGRVQTPTLVAIVEREELRKKQKISFYYQLVGTFHSNTYKGTYSINFNKQEDAEKIATLLKNKDFKIDKFKERTVSLHPQLLYDLTSLQREANSKLKLTAQQTLNIAQKLYELKLTSYPRTDSRYITTDLVKTVTTTANKISRIIGVDKKEIKSIYSAVVNNSKVSDHYAIIPTGDLTHLSELNNKERQVFDLIVRRFISVFLGDAKVCKQSWESVRNKHIFTTNLEAVLVPGWKKAYGVKPENKPPKMSGIHKLVETEVVKKKKGKTPSYTDASILKWMEQMGLGTPATRAGIIEHLKKVGYINRVKNQLIPTDKGYNLVNNLRKLQVEQLMSAELTKQFETALEQIKNNKMKQSVFLNAIAEFTKLFVNKVAKMQ